MAHFGPRPRFWLLTVGSPAVVATGWWLLTPGGLPGSMAGVSILTGILLFFIGLGRAGGMDTALDNLHPGANVGQMAEQGLAGERRFLQPRRRWVGTLTMLGGAAYIAFGALIWQLR